MTEGQFVPFVSAWYSIISFSFILYLATCILFPICMLPKEAEKDKSFVTPLYIFNTGGTTIIMYRRRDNINEINIFTNIGMIPRGAPGKSRHIPEEL